ncbi:unnamed protein product [Closterium sp. Naga37s-1]|nr:unnamed protein product [Closterium sp. Naga37s-1]
MTPITVAQTGEIQGIPLNASLNLFRVPHRSMAAAPSLAFSHILLFNSRSSTASLVPTLAPYYPSQCFLSFPLASPLSSYLLPAHFLPAARSRLRFGIPEFPADRLRGSSFRVRCGAAPFRRGIHVFPHGISLAAVGLPATHLGLRVSRSARIIWQRGRGRRECRGRANAADCSGENGEGGTSEGRNSDPWGNSLEAFPKTADTAVATEARAEALTSGGGGAGGASGADGGNWTEVEGVGARGKAEQAEEHEESETEWGADEEAEDAEGEGGSEEESDGEWEGEDGGERDGDGDGDGDGGKEAIRRERISEANRGRVPWNKGRRWSDGEQHEGGWGGGEAGDQSGLIVGAREDKGAHQGRHERPQHPRAPQGARPPPEVRTGGGGGRGRWGQGGLGAGGKRCRHRQRYYSKGSSLLLTVCKHRLQLSLPSTHRCLPVMHPPLSPLPLPTSPTLFSPPPHPPHVPIPLHSLTLLPSPLSPTSPSPPSSPPPPPYPPIPPFPAPPLPRALTCPRAPAPSVETRALIAAKLRANWQQRHEHMALVTALRQEWHAELARAAAAGGVGERALVRCRNGRVLYADEMEMGGRRRRRRWKGGGGETDKEGDGDGDGEERWEVDGGVGGQGELGGDGEGGERRMRRRRQVERVVRGKHSEEHRKRISEAIKAKWADPEYRSRVASAVRLARPNSRSSGDSTSGSESKSKRAERRRAASGEGGRPRSSSSSRRRGKAAEGSALLGDASPESTREGIPGSGDGAAAAADAPDSSDAAKAAKAAAAEVVVIPNPDEAFVELVMAAEAQSGEQGSLQGDAGREEHRQQGGVEGGERGAEGEEGERREGGSGGVVTPFKRVVIVSQRGGGEKRGIGGEGRGDEGDGIRSRERRGEAAFDGSATQDMGDIGGGREKLGEEVEEWESEWEGEDGRNERPERQGERGRTKQVWVGGAWDGVLLRGEMGLGEGLGEGLKKRGTWRGAEGRAGVNREMPWQEVLREGDKDGGRGTSDDGSGGGDGGENGVLGGVNGSSSTDGSSSSSSSSRSSGMGDGSVDTDERGVWDDRAPPSPPPPRYCTSLSPPSPPSPASPVPQGTDGGGGAGSAGAGIFPTAPPLPPLLTCFHFPRPPSRSPSPLPRVLMAEAEQAAQALAAVAGRDNRAMASLLETRRLLDEARRAVREAEGPHGSDEGEARQAGPGEMGEEGGR